MVATLWRVITLSLAFARQLGGQCQRIVTERILRKMSAYPKDLDQGWRRRLRSRVLRWYDQNGRKLPWRESADPYRIWVSEIMLQQTTVAAVVPYFERFIERFPDVRRLAEAEQDQVLHLWEGLGYYSRARNLHKAAGVVVHEMNSRFPESADELEQLPGIGPYTAGAISSFAFNRPAAIVEANTLRLFSRLIELDIDPRGTQGQKKLWKFAGWIVSRKRAADFNQAVMDIGSQVCCPVDPKCSTCPLMPSCKSFEQGRQSEIPLKKPKPKITDVTEVSVAVRKGGRYLLRQRTDSERWAGLWDFVRFEVRDEDVVTVQMPERRQTKGPAALPGQQSLFADDSAKALSQLPPSLSARVNDLTGTMVRSYEPVTEIRHAVTRYRIRLLCLVCNFEDGRLKQGAGYQWCSRNQLRELPLSTTGRRFAELLDACR
ncbi:MAG: A/G-specific adenine glycosylase [Fuerstiella sp.]|nr:A/G-specific adenine glycosylase [Fuerstiella sp.]